MLQGLVAAGVALILYGLISFVFARKIVHPHRGKLLGHPMDLGLPWEEVSFTSRDDIRLRGWLLPGTRPGLIIQTHPNPFNRTGFDPRDQGFPPLYSTAVDLLASAAVLQREGYSVLMFDFRNAGESGRSKTGIGLFEWMDVEAALLWARQDSRFTSGPLGLASYCMGADASIWAAQKAPEAFSRVSCLLAVQPISAQVFIRSYLKDRYTSLSLVLMPLVNLMVQWMGSYPFAAMTPRIPSPDLKCPVLFLQARKDPWTEPQDLQDIFQACGSQDKSLVYLEEPVSRFDAYNWIHRNPALMVDFFRKYWS